MKHYNLIDEKWITVEYLDGHTEEVGIRQCLIDAYNIKDIIPPSFRRDTMFIYYVPLMRLLTTIVMAAYFKPETHFASSNLRYLENFNETLYTDTIKEYLDKFYNRFDIFDNTTPFLQNIGLVGKVEASNKFIFWNPFAPCENNKVFGKSRSQNTSCEMVTEQFKMSFKEYAYFLLYVVTMGSSPMHVQYSENSLEKGCFTYIILSGKNLAETVCSNIYALNTSWTNEPESDYNVYDKPVWELNSVFEINEYLTESGTVAENNLLCSFYPGISIMYGDVNEDENLVKSCIRAGKDYIKGVTLNTKETDALSVTYISKNSVVAVSTKENILYYKSFNPSADFISSLCVLATKRLEDNFSCGILSNMNIKNLKVRVFFRCLNDKKVCLLECGEVIGNNSLTWDILKEDKKHYFAEKYQDMFSKIRYYFNSCVDEIFKDNKTNKIKVIKRSFCDFVENDFFTCFTDDLINNEEICLTEAFIRMKKEAFKIISNNIQFSVNIINAVESKKKFENSVSKYATKEGLV